MSLRAKLVLTLAAVAVPLLLLAVPLLIVGGLLSLGAAVFA